MTPGTLILLSQQYAESDAGEGIVEEPVDARRYIEALRRHAGLILGAAVAVAVLVLLISLSLPKTYSATAKVAPSVQATQSAATTSQPAQLNLATLQAYITSPPVLTAAARKVPGETADSLQQKLNTTIDSGANIVEITAHDGNAARAAQLANTVARTFLGVRTAAEQAQFVQQANSLTVKMQAARAAGSSGLATALQQQISNVAAQEASAGSDLQLLAPAPVPTSAGSPRPTRDAFFALFVVLFIGVLAVGARELLAPRVSSGRELSGLMGVPILGRIPRVTGGQHVPQRARDPGEAESYRFLAKSLELSAWEGRSRLVAVTSAARGEGRTTAVTRLGAAIAETGTPTLLVSADLRSPALDEVFGIAPGDGLGTTLISQNGHRGVFQLSRIERMGENLYVLPSGPPPADPAAIVTNELVRSLCEHLRGLDFEYVLFDLPPLTAAAETQVFVRQADATLLVSMVGVASAEQLTETRELLARLSVQPIGIALLGVRSGARQTPRGTVEQLRRSNVRRRRDEQPRPPPASADAPMFELASSPEPLLPELDLELADSPIAASERSDQPAPAAKPAGAAEPAKSTPSAKPPGSAQADGSTARRSGAPNASSSKASTQATPAPAPEDPAPPATSPASPPNSRDQPSSPEQPPPK